MQTEQPALDEEDGVMEAAVGRLIEDRCSWSTSRVCRQRTRWRWSSRLRCLCLILAVRSLTGTGSLRAGS